MARPFFLQRVRGRNNDGISDDEDLILVNPDLHNCIVLCVCILYRYLLYKYYERYRCYIIRYIYMKIVSVWCIMYNM